MDEFQPTMRKAFAQAFVGIAGILWMLWPLIWRLALLFAVIYLIADLAIKAAA